MGAEGERAPAFYALRPGGWRDYVTLLHLPYSAWHLSYVAIGAALAPDLSARRVGFVLAAFALALGVGAHALDELRGRPLGTAIPARVLALLAAASIAAAVALGAYVAVTDVVWVAPTIPVGAFLVLAYNLELFGGRFHGDLWFAAAWGAFPLLTGYVAMAGALAPEALAGAVFAFALSLAQRRLSTRARHVRRRVSALRCELVAPDGTVETLSRERLIEPEEAALRLLTLATVALAAALVVARLA